MYVYTCRTCQVRYVGETARHAWVRFAEHQGLSWKTDKKVKQNVLTAVKQHEVERGHAVSSDDFKIHWQNRSNRWLGRKIFRGIDHQNAEASVEHSPN